jgi:hypothetical protein
MTATFFNVIQVFQDPTGSPLHRRPYLRKLGRFGRIHLDHAVWVNMHLDSSFLVARQIAQLIKELSFTITCYVFPWLFILPGLN